MPDPTSYKISGHETFALRYAWLPKCVSAVSANPLLFADEDSAMVRLGVGKNMVRAIRFWGEATGVVASEGNGKSRGYGVTELGRTILAEDGGHDPYLEDDQTLWLLHWQLASASEAPLLGWDFLLNQWHEPDLVPTVIHLAVMRELEKSPRRISDSSVRGHLAVFFHTYCATRSNKTQAEENLDCPLVELGLVQYRCDRATPAGKSERIYAFRKGRKPEIGNWLFAYTLLDFWRRRCPNENTLSFRQLAYGHGSPGQLFKLDELDLRGRLEWLADEKGLPVSYSDTSLVQAVRKDGELTDALMASCLGRAYSA